MFYRPKDMTGAEWAYFCKLDELVRRLITARDYDDTDNNFKYNHGDWQQVINAIKSKIYQLEEITRNNMIIND